MLTNKNSNKLKYLKIDKVEKFIDEMSNIDLEKNIKIIKEKGMGGIVKGGNEIEFMLAGNE